jgi:uridine phosphorylase
MFGRLLKPLSGQDKVRSVESSRGFLTITGQWKGYPVSIITHLMGFGNMDLFLRETRAVVDAPMLVIRIGTCGSLNSEVGQIHIPTYGSVAVLRNPDAFLTPSNNGASDPPYRITQPCHPDAVLNEALIREMKRALGEEGTYAWFHAPSWLLVACGCGMVVCQQAGSVAVP